MMRLVTAAILMAVGCLVNPASAEVLVNGRVVKWTADRYIEHERMTCSYGPWRFETLSNGTAALIRSKHCEKASSNAR